MTRILEKMSLLGLSLLLISAFSISTALPPMLDYYSPTFSAAQVELLVSVPSFSVVAMLLLNSFIDKWLSDRQLIVTGLLLLSSAGIFPFFVQAYPLVLLSRIAFGMGIGLINAKAIAIISQRYQGKERVQMLGIRGSMELIGGASCSLLVGQLLKIHWTFAFLIYGFGFVPPFCAIDGAGGEEADYKKKTSSEQKRPWYDSWHGSFSRFCHLYQFFD